MGKQRKRRASVTKLKPGERLTIEVTLPQKGVVVVKTPVGGTVTMEKSTVGLKVGGDMP